LQGSRASSRLPDTEGRVGASGDPVRFGPDLLATTWDGLVVSHHCTVSRGENPIGVLFRMEHPATDECSAFSSYRFEGIDGSCLASLQRNLVLPDL
jgi:hypothetical protein